MVRRVREVLPDLFFSVSATTRDPQPGEVDGLRDYRFISREVRPGPVADDQLLEWADIHGGLQRSGTPAQPVEERLAAGEPVLVEVDLTGARNIVARLPEATTVFLAPPAGTCSSSGLPGVAPRPPKRSSGGWPPPAPRWTLSTSSSTCW